MIVLALIEDKRAELEGLCVRTAAPVSQAA